MSFKNRAINGNLTLTEEEFQRLKGSGWCFVAFGKVGEIESVCFLREVVQVGMVPWDLSDYSEFAFAFKTGDMLRWVAALEEDIEDLIDEWVDEWVGQTKKMTDRLRARIFR